MANGRQPFKKFTANGKKRAKTASAASRMKAVAALRMKANVRTGGFTGIEKKFVDSLSTSTAFTTAWAILAPTAGITNCISAPGIGTSESERDGRVFTLMSVHVRMTITGDTLESQAAPIVPLNYRVCLVWDTQTNGAAVTGTSVMDAGATNDLDAFRNLQNSKRFIILGDTGHMTLQRPNTNEGAINLFATAPDIVHVSFNKSFKMGIKVRAIGTTADVASISDNSFSLIGIASSTACSYTFETRCRFTG